MPNDGTTLLQFCSPGFSLATGHTEFKPKAHTCCRGSLETCWNKTTASPPVVGPSMWTRPLHRQQTVCNGKSLSHSEEICQGNSQSRLHSLSNVESQALWSNQQHVLLARKHRGTSESSTRQVTYISKLSYVLKTF